MKFLSFLIISASILITGCVKKTEDDIPRTYLFDPRIPGGRIGGDFVVEQIEDLAADVSVVGQIKLTWRVSPLYHTLPYKIRIYKHRGKDPNWFLPEPSEMYNAAELYKVAELNKAECPDGHCREWIDKNPEDGSEARVVGDADYKYWVYIYLNNRWSRGKEILAHSKSGTSGFTLPNANNFWSQKTWDLGNKPNTPQGQNTEYHSYASIEPRQTSCSKIEEKNEGSVDFQTNRNSCQEMTGCEWSQKTKTCASNKERSTCESNTECSWNSQLNSCSSITYQCSNTSHIGFPKGKTAFARDGAVMYVADTDNNRVVIYTRDMALACDQYKSDPELFQACQYQAQGFPFQPKNIIGQPTQHSNSTCNVSCQAKSSQSSCLATSGCNWDGQKNKCDPNFGYNKCLSRPSYITVSNGKLVISDSGNDRVVVWDHLPINGCDPEIVPGRQTATDCEPSFQIGKKSFEDFAKYNLATEGSMILNNPTGTFIYGDDLYIADTGHNRVVKVKSFEDTQSFSCNDTNWNTSLCQFSSVLGQPSFGVNRTFKDIIREDEDKQAQCSVESNPPPPGLAGGTKQSCEAVAIGCTWKPGQISGQGSCILSDPLIERVGIGNVINQSHEHVLKRYFSNPTVVKVSEDNRLLVGVNEDFQTKSTVDSPIYLKSRILGWNSNPLDGESPVCSHGSFPSGGCDANFVIGQADFRTLVSVQGSSGKYSDVVYGLESLDDFDIFGKFLVGVDSINNLIYLWDDWSLATSAGRPPTHKVKNPLGAPNPNNSQNYPYLKGLGAITIVPETFLIYVTDSSDSKVYEVKSY